VKKRRRGLGRCGWMGCWWGWREWCRGSECIRVKSGPWREGVVESEFSSRGERGERERRKGRKKKERETTRDLKYTMAW
jgi:hypothetical protein